MSLEKTSAPNEEMGLMGGKKRAGKGRRKNTEVFSEDIFSSPIGWGQFQQL
jgi:hypothetical protein